MKTLTKIITAISLTVAGAANVGAAIFIGAQSSNKAEALYTPSTHYEVSDTASELTSYYSSISSSATGTTLLSQLQSLNSTKRKKTMGYSTMGTSASSSPYIYTDYVLGSTTKDSNGQVYGSTIASFYTKTSATSWNREHMWPNSRGGSAVEGDILHTRPTISSENSSRGNSFYVEGMNNSSNGWDPYTAGYEEWVRGECARTILYCVVANSGFSLSDASSISSGQTGYTSTMGDMDTLIKWHFNYTPNQYEINRNNGAEYLQGNRNPFVDHPEYVAKIWSNFNSNISSICSNNSSTYTNWTPGSCSTYGTNDASGGSTSTDPSISIYAASTSVKVGKTITLTANKSNITGTVQWYVSDSSSDVVSLSATSGDSITVSGVSEGTKTIYAYIGTVSANVSITVTAASSVGEGEKVTDIDMLSENDKVVIRTDESTPKGVTGFNNNKDATVSTTQSEWKEFIVKNYSSSGFTLYDSAASQYIASPSGNEFKYSSSGGTCSPDSEGHLVCNNRYLCVNGTNYRFYTAVGSYIPFYIYLSGSGSSTEKTLSSIAVKTAPTKTVYTAGEYFAPAGLVITATYSDSTTEEISYSSNSSAFTFTPSTSTALTTSNTSITIGYGGKSCSQAITVNASTKTLSSIAVSTAPTKTTYTAGEYFAPAGLVITRNYSDSTSDTYTYSGHESEFTFSPSTSTALATTHTSVTITYNSKSCSQAITVNAGSQSLGDSEVIDFTTAGYSDQAQVSSYEGTYCDVTLDKGSNSNPPKWFNSGSAVRCYGSNTITISSSSTIVKIEFTFGGSDGSNEITANTGSFTSPTWTGSATSVTFTIGGTTGNRRIQKITVTYESSGGTDPITSISATVSKTFHPGETITTKDIVVKDNNNKSIVGFTFANNNYSFTYSDAASGGASTSKTFTNAISYESLTCSLTVQVQRTAYAAPAASTLTHTGSEFQAGGVSTSYATGQTATVDGITFSVDGYIYSSKLSLSQSKTSAPGKVVNTTPYPSGITGVTVSGASPDIQLSTNGSSWVDLSSATPSSVNYYYVKIYYKTTSQSSYVNITQIDVTVKGYETATNLSNYVMYEDTNNQCTSKFSVAQGYFENMPSSERSTFMTSSDYVISTARERLLAWAANQGKTITLSGGDYVITGAQVHTLTKAFDQQGLAIIIIITSLVTITFVCGYLYLRKKKKTN